MESATAAEQPAPLRTRFGRTVRAPTRYEPVEVPLDDDSELEPEEVTDTSSEEGSPVKKRRRRCQLESDDESEDDSDSDVGSLKDFVVSDGEVEETDTEEVEQEEDLFDSEADSDTD